MKTILKILNTIKWFFIRLTPNGRKSYILYKAFDGIQMSQRKGLITRVNVIDSAKELLKQKKILAFNKGKSISKPKTSDHKLIENVSHKHDKELKAQGLKITKKGKIKHA